MKNDELTLLPQGYDDLLKGLKARVHKARMSAALAANAELVSLYIDIGKAILERRDAEGWEPKSSSGWGMTFEELSLTLRGFRQEILDICAN